MAVKNKAFGVENPKEHFAQLGIEGNKDLNDIREEIIARFGDGKNRSARVWGITDAAKLVGRSIPWMRDNGNAVHVNAANRPIWTLEEINDLRDKAKTRYSRPEGSEPMIIAFSKLKGGVGNTTTCAHFSHFLAIAGLKVLVIDFDPQGSMTQLVGGVNPDAAIDIDDLPNEALVNAPEDLKYSIRGTYFHNVDLIPANQMLQNVEMDLNQQALNNADEAQGLPSFHRRLEAGLAPIKNDYDVILVDCPPNQSTLTMNALAAANGLVNPVRPVLLDRASMVMYCNSASAFYEFNEDLRLRYHRVLINQHKNIREANDQVKAIRRLYGDLVLENTIMDAQEVKNTAGVLETVYSVNRQVGSRESYTNAIKSLDLVFGEMLNEIKQIWKMEAA